MSRRPSKRGSKRADGRLPLLVYLAPDVKKALQDEAYELGTSSYLFVEDLLRKRFGLPEPAADESEAD